MLRTAVASAHVALVESALRRPFITASGRRERTVNATIFINLRGGASGYGEASTSIAQRRLTPAVLRGALEKMALRARGRDVRDWRALIDEAWQRHGDASPAVAAFEAALLSALAAEAGTSLAGWFGGASRRIETDLTISASNDPEETRTAAAEAAASGFRLLKIKVVGRSAEDLARVRAARLGAPKARLLLDGNQGFTPASALKFIETVLKTGAPVELFEQPTPKNNLRALAFVTKRCPVPVAADESVATPSDALRAIEAGVTAINIKLAKSGISRGLEIAAVARAAKRTLMIGCMAETARGLAASVHLALGTGFFTWCDLDSDLLLIEDAKARRLAGWTRRGRFASLELSPDPSRDRHMHIAQVNSNISAMAKEFPGTLLEFEHRFRTEDACLDYLAGIRWPDGFRCPECHGAQSWKTQRGLWKCTACGTDVSVTAGTSFHRSKVSLRLWFRAIWWVTNQKTGVNAMGLQRLLGLGSYRTAWMILHKLRRAMVRPGRELLSGKIELDETIIGGVRRGGPGKRGKSIVIIAAEIRGQGMGRIRLERLPDDSKTNIVCCVKRAVAPGAEIISDGWWPHNAIVSHGYSHDRVVLDGMGKQASIVVLPRVHRVAALLKRWLLGTYQGRASRDQLDHYLDEFSFRFNRRLSGSRGQLFYRLVQQCAVLPPTPYRMMVATPSRNAVAGT